MLASSERFAQSIIRSHTVATKCEILYGGNVIGHLDIVGGSVSADMTRRTRRQCSLSLQDPTGSMVPVLAGDILQPFSGYYLRISRGIRWDDGTEELFPLGTFAPYNPKVKDTDDSLEITVEGYDRSQIISRLAWTQPFTIPDGTNTAVAVRLVLQDRMYGMKYNLATTTATVPVTTLGLGGSDNRSSDPWMDASRLAESDGQELFIDANDTVVMRPIPNPDTNAVVHIFAEGEACTFESVTRATDADNMYTGVIVTSEGSAVVNPIRVDVWRDDTPLRIPFFYPTTLITNEAQAIQTAISILHREGRAEISADMSIVPDPRLEVGDVVQIIRERSKLNDVFVISQISMPLDAEGKAQVTTDRRRMT